MTQPHEIAPAGWLGLLGAWLANDAVWATAGMSPLAALAAIAAGSTAYLRHKKVTSQR